MANRHPEHMAFFKFLTLKVSLSVSGRIPESRKTT